MGRLKEWFAEKDLKVTDVPLALAYHEVLGLGTLAAWWALCYAATPTARVLNAVRGVQPRAVAAGSAVFRRGVGAVAFSAPRRRLPFGRALRGKERLAGSLVESSAIRAAIKPVTLPLKLWLSYELVMLTKRLTKKT